MAKKLVPFGAAAILAALFVTLGLMGLQGNSVVAQTKGEICDNGIDDDGDKLVDCADPDCVNAPNCQSPPTQENCTNGVDDDGDKLIDCADPDCANASNCQNPPPSENCSNGIDDDGDKLVDCADPDCASAPNCQTSGGEPCSPGWWRHHTSAFDATCVQVPGWTCADLWTAIWCKGSDASCRRQEATSALNAINGCTE